MSLHKKIFKQTSFYLIGEVLILVGSFISFPIFTRLLSREAYGIMSLIGITLLLSETIFSGGLRHSVQRFYGEIRESGQDSTLFATSFGGALILSLIGTTVLFGGTYVISQTKLLSSEVVTLVFIASSLLIVRLMTQMVACFYRVQELPMKYLVIALATKYSGLILSIIFVAVYMMGLCGYYTGLVIGELIVFAICLTIWLKGTRLHSRLISFSKLMEMLKYGGPLIISSLAYLLLNIGDRYIIGYYMTSEDVATYSIAYNLCDYIQNTLICSLEFSLFPLIMNAWAKKDIDDVRSALSQVVKYYMFLGIPIIMVFSFIGGDIIILLASAKYKEAANVIPLIIIGIMLKGLFTPLSMGLHFRKRTWHIGILVASIAILNLVMNIILVPLMHLYGAALSTLVCFFLYILIGGLMSFRFFSFKLPYKAVARFIVSGLFIPIILKGSCFSQMSLFMVTFLKINMALASYVFIVVILDADIREKAIAIYRRICYRRVS